MVRGGKHRHNIAKGGGYAHYHYGYNRTPNNTAGEQFKGEAAPADANQCAQNILEKVRIDSLWKNDFLIPILAKAIPLELLQEILNSESVQEKIIQLITTDTLRQLKRKDNLHSEFVQEMAIISLAEDLGPKILELITGKSTHVESEGAEVVEQEIEKPQKQVADVIAEKEKIQEQPESIESVCDKINKCLESLSFAQTTYLPDEISNSTWEVSQRDNGAFQCFNSKYDRDYALSFYKIGIEDDLTLDQVQSLLRVLEKEVEKNPKQVADVIKEDPDKVETENAKNRLWNLVDIIKDSSIVVSKHSSISWLPLGEKWGFATRSNMHYFETPDRSTCISIAYHINDFQFLKKDPDEKRKEWEMLKEIADCLEKTIRFSHLVAQLPPKDDSAENKETTSDDLKTLIEKHCPEGDAQQFKDPKTELTVVIEYFKNNETLSFLYITDLSDQDSPKNTACRFYSFDELFDELTPDQRAIVLRAIEGSAPTGSSENNEQLESAEQIANKIEKLFEANPLLQNRKLHFLKDPENNSYDWRLTLENNTWHISGDGPTGWIKCRFPTTIKNRHPYNDLEIMKSLYRTLEAKISRFS
jgi:hypothetical protein